MPETQNKEFFFQKDADGQTPISSAFLGRDYETANNLLMAFKQFTPSQEEILQSLNHDNEVAEKELKMLSTANRNTPHGFEFIASIKSAFSARNFLTKIQKTEPDWQTAKEWAEDDREELLATQSLAATIQPSLPPEDNHKETPVIPAAPEQITTIQPSLPPEDNHKETPVIPAAPEQITTHSTRPSKRSIREAGREAFGMNVTRSHTLFWLVAEKIAAEKIHA